MANFIEVTLAETKKVRTIAINSIEYFEKKEFEAEFVNKDELIKIDRELMNTIDAEKIGELFKQKNVILHKPTIIMVEGCFIKIYNQNGFEVLESYEHIKQSIRGDEDEK